MVLAGLSRFSISDDCGYSNGPRVPNKYVLYSANGVVKNTVAWVACVYATVFGIAIVVYSLLLIMVLLSWIAAFQMIDKGRSEIPKKVKSIGANAG